MNGEMPASRNAGRNAGRDAGRDKSQATLLVAILAGGRSRRMGRDKAFVPFDGRPLVARAVALGRAISPLAMLVVHRDQLDEDRYRQLAADLEIRLCADEYDYKGPLGGLVTALRSGQMGNGVVLLACDMPYLTRELIQLLTERHRAGGYAATVPVDQEGRLQPLVGVYSESVLPVAEEMIGLDILRFEALFDRVRTRVIDFTEIADLRGSERFFTNLNRPADLEAET
jgi:molybdopterin-guanine dinucleotide biosynthesis protein A